MRKKHKNTTVDLSPVLSRMSTVEASLDFMNRSIAKLAVEQQWVSVRRFAEMHDVHPCTVRRAIVRGELDVRRIGRRLVVQVPFTFRAATDDEVDESREPWCRRRGGR